MYGLIKVNQLNTINFFGLFFLGLDPGKRLFFLFDDGDS